MRKHDGATLRPFAHGDVSVVPMTPEMLSTIAELHLIAFKGYMNTRVGNAYVRSFMNWFMRTKGAVALAAVDGQEVLGYVVGIPTESLHAMDVDLLPVGAIGVLLRPWLFFSAPARRTLRTKIKSILNKHLPEPAEFYLPRPTMELVGIAVSPVARGRKVGSRLVERFETASRELGMRSLKLSVYPDNAPARRLYENSGWSPVPGSEASVGAMTYFRILDGASNDRSSGTVDGTHA